MGTVAQTLERYDLARTRAFRWRDGLSVWAKLGLALGMACVTGLMAQLKIPLPNTLVPITGQVFAALLAGVLLGQGYGALSQVFYVGLGTAGVPWFAGWSGGSAILLGVTGGYLIGLIVAATFVGFITHKFVFARRFVPQCFIMLAGVGIIYLFGAPHFAAVMGAGIEKTWLMAVKPFLFVDVLKAYLAASTARALLPRGEGARSDAH